MKCPKCGAEVPEVSRFCLSCGAGIPAPKTVPLQQNADADPEGYSMLLFGLAFMMFFFAIAPILLGLWIGAALMMAVGLVLVVVGYNMVRSNKAEIEERRQEASIKIKCRYCGSLNGQEAERCNSCGATL